MAARLQHFFFLFLFILAVLPRVLFLGSHPDSLQNDEASFLLNAIAIKQTGMDEDGRSFPLFLHSFIDPKPALYTYLQIPFIFLFGENATAARMPAALLGVGSIFFMYAIVSTLFSKNIARLACILIAISPWHIMLSRATQEVMLSFFFTMAAIYTWQLYLERRKTRFLILTSLATLLSMYSYHAAKITLPIMLLLLTFYAAKKNGRKLGVLLLMGMSICSVVITTILSPNGFARFNAISLFSDPTPQLLLEEQTRTATDRLPTAFIRVFSNKYVAYGIATAQRFGQHLTPDFFFIRGGEPSRYSVPFHGLLYHIDAILLILGIWYVVRKEQPSVAVLLGGWIVAAITPSSLTSQEVPSMIRSASMLLPITVFLAVGISTGKQFKHHLRSIFLLFLMLGYLWGISYFFYQFVIQQPAYHSWSRNYADQELAQYLKEHEKKYDKIYISSKSGQAYAYLVLNGLIPLKNLQSTRGNERGKSTIEFGKYTIHPQDCATEKDVSQLKKGVLTISSIGCKDIPQLEHTDTIGFRDGAEFYEVYRYREE
jgi:hypothetical protein